MKNLKDSKKSLDGLLGACVLGWMVVRCMCAWLDVC